jgi:transposase
MPSLRPNAIRIKRFRELKETLRTQRDRLLVGIDIAKAQHVAQVRLAHTRVLDQRLTVPNTAAGFAAFWARLEQRRAEAGVRETVCAVEPTGTYHEAFAQFLEAQGADVVLVSNQVAHYYRKTLDGTWGKSDPKDAHNLCELLEDGKVLFYSLPEAPLTALRRLVRLLRHARVERGACQARFRNTLLPLLGPAGEPLPPGLLASLPAALRRLCPAAPGVPRPRGRPRRAAPGRGAGAPGAGLPPGLAGELTDLVSRLSAVQARLAQLEAALVQVATPLPAYALLRTLPGLGPTLGAILLAELGDIAWFSKFSQLRKLAGLDIQWVQTGKFTGTARISRCGKPLLRWALYQAAVGACRNPGWRAYRERLIAKRAGDPHAFFKATTELAAKLLRLVWGVWRSGRPYDPARRGAHPPAQGPHASDTPRGRPAGRRSAPRPVARRPRASARA